MSFEDIEKFSLTPDLIQLMRDLIPAPKHDAVAVSIVVKARLGTR